MLGAPGGAEHHAHGGCAWRAALRNGQEMAVGNSHGCPSRPGAAKEMAAGAARPQERAAAAQGGQNGHNTHRSDPRGCSRRRCPWLGCPVGLPAALTRICLLPGAAPVIYSLRFGLNPELSEHQRHKTAAPGALRPARAGFLIPLLYQRTRRSTLIIRQGRKDLTSGCTGGKAACRVLVI